MKKPLVIAHRGYSSRFPENTIVAFQEAMKAKADGFECDLRLSSDGRVVVFHDDDLKRLCGREGTIETLPWSEIQKLKILNSSAGIPLLQELLTEFHTTTINLEIKSSPRGATNLVEAVLRDLTKVRPEGRILFSSFDSQILHVLRQMDPEKRLGEVGILVETKDLAQLQRLSAEIDADTWNVPRQVLKMEKELKGISTKPLWVWTVDEHSDWQALQDSSLRVEAIITNKPGDLRNFLDGNSIPN